MAIWLMIYLIPGDPAIALLGPDVTEEQLQLARERMGLHRPLPIQYGLWLGRVARGDLGVSVHQRRSRSARCSGNAFQ